MWHVVGDDITEALLKSFEWWSGHLLKELNRTLITLVPNKDCPVEVSDYKPISLCNVAYKVCSKTMVTDYDQSYKI